MNTDNFVWNDKLVGELTEWASSNDWTYLPSKNKWYNEEDEINITPITTEQLMGKFKQSKQPPISKDDWEVLSVKDNNGKIWEQEIYRGEPHFCGNTYGYVLSSKIRPDYWSIHSVKRLSDGEVFQIGDTIEGAQIDNHNIVSHHPTKITSIRIINGTIGLAYGKGGEVIISHAKKLPTHSPKVIKPPLGLLPKLIWEEQRIWDIAAAIERYKEAGKEIPQEWINEYYDLSKQKNRSKPAPSIQEEKKEVLFTTEDGIEIPQGYDMELWRVFTLPSSYEMWKPYNLGMPRWKNLGEKYFYKKEAAEQYILLNKPCLSANDIKWWLEKHFNYPDGINVNQLKELVKQKLNP